MKEIYGAQLEVEDGRLILSADFSYVNDKQLAAICSLAGIPEEKLKALTQIKNLNHLVHVENLEIVKERYNG